MPETPANPSIVPPAEPAARNEAARAGLAALDETKPPEAKPVDEKPEETKPAEPPINVDEAREDFAWIVVGLLAILVWFMSKAGPKAVARLDRVKSLGIRAGGRIGPRVARTLGVWLVGLSIIAEGVEMLARESLSELPPAAPPTTPTTTTEAPREAPAATVGS